jgi:ferredoxin-NADP reductase
MTQQGTLKVRVASHESVARQVVALRLEAADGGRLPSWTPGAHVDVFLGDDLVRQYSLCSRPSDPQWRLAVLEELQGRGGSAYVHRRLRVGDLLEVSEPRNNFPLVPSGRPVVLVSGGIGITPLLPMAEAAHEAGMEWRMLHLVRDEASAACLEELAAFGGRVTRHVDAVAGIIDLVTTLDGLGAGQSDGYAWGPQGLLDARESYAAQRPGCTLRTERFASSEPAVRAGDHPFVVELADGTEVEVAADETILQALTNAGCRTLSSCQEGVCGTCETPVISGTPDHRDHVLSDEEKASGEVIMPCVSRCRGDRLVLDL